MSQPSLGLRIQTLTRDFGADLEQIAARVLSGGDADGCEREVLALLLRTGQQALETILAEAGVGDLGERLEVPGADGPVTYRRRKVETRLLRTVFGNVALNRFRYVNAEGACLYPLDAELRLSGKDTTPLRQEWLERFAVRGSFASARADLEALLGISTSARTIEEIVAYRAQEAMDFRSGVEPAPTPEGKLLVVSIDEKGVPMRKPQGRRAKRLGPGEKPNRKKMATVGVILDIEPFHRNIEAIVSSQTMEPEERTPRPRAERRTVLARIGDRETVFRELRRELNCRLQDDTQVVVVIDGDDVLDRSVEEHFGDIPGILVLLDWWHLREYLWGAARALCPNDEEGASRWVEEKSRAVLEGRPHVAVAGMKQSLTKRKLAKSAGEEVRKAIRYMENRAHLLDYPAALRSGAPIASGAAEGACGHVVRDRMEHTGMRWTRAGAQALLDLRCIHISDLRDEHRRFVRVREQTRLHAWHRGEAA